MTKARAALASAARKLGRAVHWLFFNSWGFRPVWIAPLIIIVFVALIVVVDASANREAQNFCDDVSAMTGRVTVLSESGCYVEFGDRFVPYEKWLYLEEKGGAQ